MNIWKKLDPARRQAILSRSQEDVSEVLAVVSPILAALKRDGEEESLRQHRQFEKPEPFVPGRVTRVAFELPDVQHAFLKGHRIMVQVQSSWFPLFDRNPQKFCDIRTADEKDFQKATHRLHRGPKHPSSIEFRVLSKQ